MLFYTLKFAAGSHNSKMRNAIFTARARNHTRKIFRFLKILLDAPDVATFSGYFGKMAKRKTEEVNEEISGITEGMGQPKKTRYQENDVKNWSISDVNDFLRSKGYEDEIIMKFVGKIRSFIMRSF